MKVTPARRNPKYREATPKEIADRFRMIASYINTTQFERKPTRLRAILDDTYRNLKSDIEWMEAQGWCE